jgi:hypothetical protein
MQPVQLAPQQQPSSTSPAVASDASRQSSELLWRYERAQLAYDATVAAAAAGDKAPSPSAEVGRFVLPWAQRQPWEWEWEQQQHQSPRARAAAGILMALSSARC